MAMNRFIKKLHRLLQSFRTAQGGNVVITFALALIPVIGFVGTAVDYSRGNDAKAALQASLDGAVLAAAGATMQSSTNRIELGKKHFSGNFRLPNPPVPDISINGNLVEGTAQYVMPVMFLRVVGVTQMNVAGVSQALVEVTPICLLLLEKTQIALPGNSDSQLSAKDCAIRVNSTNKEAIFANSMSKLIAKSFCVTGNYKENSGGDIAPNPAIGCAPVSDPLASLPEPVVGPCTHPNDVKVENGQSLTLGPGVYCGTVDVSSGGNLTLTAGNYVFKKKLEINAKSKLTGNQVMLFFATKDAYINVNSASTIQISAPASGAYAGILIFQTRDSLASGAPPFNFNSDSSSFLEGTIYMPNGKIIMNSLSNTNEAASYTTVIAQVLEMNSDSKFQLNSNYKGKTPLPPTLASFGATALLRLSK